MGNPDVRWSVVFSCCLHNEHLLSSFHQGMDKRLLWSKRNYSWGLWWVSVSSRMLHLDFLVRMLVVLSRTW